MNLFPHCDCRCEVIREEINFTLDTLRELQTLGEKGKNNEENIELKFEKVATLGGEGVADESKEQSTGNCSAQTKARFRKTMRSEFDSKLNYSGWLSGLTEWAMRWTSGLVGRDTGKVDSLQAEQYAKFMTLRMTDYLRSLELDYKHHCE